MKIIGITGTIGSGKGAVVDYLVQEYSFVHYSVRAHLNELLEAAGLEKTRPNMTRFANDLRGQHGPAFLIESLYYKAALQNRNCIIESIRTVGEIDCLRAKADFTLLAVDADINLRYNRIVNRKSSTDNISFQQFKLEESVEMQSDNPNQQNLKQCIELADYTIINDGTLQSLQQHVDQIILG